MVAFTDWHLFLEALMNDGMNFDDDVNSLLTENSEIKCSPVCGLCSKIIIYRPQENPPLNLLFKIAVLGPFKVKYC